jgi:alkyldihydroxyacetonephosphate synthase
MGAQEFDRFMAQVRRELPGLQVLTAPEDLLLSAHGTYPVEYKWMRQGPYPRVPGAIVRPAHAAEVSVILRAASDARVPVIPVGGGSGIVGGTMAETGQVLIDTKLMTSFSLEPDNCTVAAGCGLTCAEMEERLGRSGFTGGQFPQSAHSATLGGMAATRAVGTFSTRYGKMDDMVTGLEVVLPGGTILRTHPAPKRSSGPELVELFLGSEGTLGVITEVSLKVYRVPESRVFRTCVFPDTGSGLRAIRRFVQDGARPAVVRLYDEAESVEWLKRLGLPQGGCYLVLVFEGPEGLVRAEEELTLQACRREGAREHGPEGATLWFEGRFATRKMLEYHRTRGRTADAVEVAAPWDRIETVWREMRAALLPVCIEVDCHFSHFYHTGASVYVIFYADTRSDDAAAERRYRECLKLALDASLAHGGNVSHHHGVGRSKAAWMAAEHGTGGLEALRAIKRSLDPHGIMNPGVLDL